MAEEKDIALLADNYIIVEIEVQEAPTVVIDTTSTTTAEISGDSAIGIVVGTLPTLAKEKTLADGIASIEGKLDNIKVDLTPVAKEETLQTESQSIKDKIDSIEFPTTDLSSVAKEDTLAQVASKVEEVGSKIDNIDLTPIENKVDEGVSTLSDKIDNIDLSAVENKVQEESAAIQSKIDGLSTTFDDIYAQQLESIIG